MAKIEITWTFEARLWLKEIYEYIAQDSPKNAQKVVASIREKAQMLRGFPEIGKKYEHPSKEDVRILLYSHYRLTYLIYTDGNISILGVFHGALDINRYLT